MRHPEREGPVKSHLERLIGRYGREESLAVGRVRRWVSTMALLGALERVEEPGGGPRFVLKGGVAIELRLEISGPEVSGGEGEFIPAISLEDFRLSGPAEIACLPLRFQIAQKIHAVTERPPDRENRRFRDLVDLLILRDLVADLGSLRIACEATFEHRATHTWPPHLDIPDASWRDGYALLASEVGIDVSDVDMAAAEVRAFVAAIAEA